MGAIAVAEMKETAMLHDGAVGVCPKNSELSPKTVQRRQTRIISRSLVLRISCNGENSSTQSKRKEYMKTSQSNPRPLAELAHVISSQPRSACPCEPITYVVAWTARKQSDDHMLMLGPVDKRLPCSTRNSAHGGTVRHRHDGRLLERPSVQEDLLAVFFHTLLANAARGEGTGDGVSARHSTKGHWFDHHMHSLVSPNEAHKGQEEHNSHRAATHEQEAEADKVDDAVEYNRNHDNHVRV